MAMILAFLASASSQLTQNLVAPNALHPFDDLARHCDCTSLRNHRFPRRCPFMKKPLCLMLIHLLVFVAVRAQSLPASSGATNPVQVSQPKVPPIEVRELKIPAGTPLEIETAYTIDSQHVR